MLNYILIFELIWTIEDYLMTIRNEDKFQKVISLKMATLAR